MEIEIAYGDLTTETTDAVVNAANAGLWAGSGVCGAIHKAAGPQLNAACKAIEGTYYNKQGQEISEDEANELMDAAEAEARKKQRQLDAKAKPGKKPKKAWPKRVVMHERCPEGDAVATPGFDLPAEYVIHAVGPVWHGGKRGEEQTHANAHRAIIRVADEIGAKTVSLPAISTGVFGFPLNLAARIAIESLDAAGAESNVETVRIVVIDKKNHDAFAKALAEFRGEEFVAEDEPVTNIDADADEFGMTDEDWAILAQVDGVSVEDAKREFQAMMDA